APRQGRRARVDRLDPRPPAAALHPAPPGLCPAARMEADARDARPYRRNPLMTPPLDLALVNGRVRTLNPDQPTATAIGVVGDTIVALGDDAAVRAEADASTEVIDLKGSAV